VTTRAKVKAIHREQRAEKRRRKLFPLTRSSKFYADNLGNKGSLSALAANAAAIAAQKA